MKVFNNGIAVSRPGFGRFLRRDMCCVFSIGSSGLRNDSEPLLVKTPVEIRLEQKDIGWVVDVGNNGILHISAFDSIQTKAPLPVVRDELLQ